MIGHCSMFLYRINFHEDYHLFRLLKNRQSAMFSVFIRPPQKYEEDFMKAKQEIWGKTRRAKNLIKMAPKNISYNLEFLILNLAVVFAF